MKKIISFSLFGNDKLYNQGMIENLKLAEQYVGWRPRIYIAENTPSLKLLEYMGAELIVMPPAQKIDKTFDGWQNDPTHSFMLWRFLSFGDPTVERTVSRDADSRLGCRDYAAIQEWEESGMLGNIIFECQAHTIGPMGGMVGLVGGLYPGISDMIQEHLSNYSQRYVGQSWAFADIIFLRDMIFSPIYFSVLTQGYGTDNPLTVPQPPGCGRFIGDIVNESDWRGKVWTESYEKEISRSISQ